MVSSNSYKKHFTKYSQIKMDFSMNNIFNLCVLGFIAILMLSCQPEKKSNALRSSDLIAYKNPNIAKIGSKQIDLKYNSDVLEKYSEVQVGSFIKTIFTNPKAYTITKVDSETTEPLAIDKVEFVSRTNYIIYTNKEIETGLYNLDLKDYGANLTLIDENFAALDTDSDQGPSDEEAGNYYEFIPVVKTHSDGVKISVIDAEIGAPSFYNIKVSVPTSFPAETNALKVLLNEKLNHALVNHSNPAVAVRETVLTGFGKVSEITKETEPVYDFYDEVIDGNKYVSIEYLIYLNSMPERDKDYNITINTGSIGLGLYDSGDFKFRFAFSKVLLKIFTNLKAPITCFLTATSGKVKCVGSNKYLATGYDTGSYSDTNPYNLSFVKGIEGVSSMAMNEYSTCVIMNQQDNLQKSKTKCWGTNYLGLLGTGSKKTAKPSRLYNQTATAGDNFQVAFPNEATELAFIGGNTTNYLKSITSATNDFCGRGFDNLLYCWGPLVNSFGSNFPDITVPNVINLKSGNFGVKRLADLAMGNNPTFCANADLEFGTTQLSNQILCGSSGLTNLTPANFSNKVVNKIAAGEGHACILLQSSGQFYADNIYCYGENDNFQLGLPESSNHAELVSPALYGDTAVDIVAGQGYTCYISSLKMLKCAGRARGNTDLTQQDDSNQGFGANQYFDFGDSRIKVKSISAGEFLICAVLEISLGSETYYAPKCWGNLQLSGYKYYLPANLSGQKQYFKYSPLIRW